MGAVLTPQHPVIKFSWNRPVYFYERAAFFCWWVVFHRAGVPVVVFSLALRGTVGAYDFRGLVLRETPILDTGHMGHTERQTEKLHSTHSDLREVPVSEVSLT